VSQISKSRLLLALLLAASLPATRLTAQDASDDPNATPLGDVARNLRKDNPPPGQVIDNDNLHQVMNQAENRHASLLRFLMDGNHNNFQLAAPDVTCSLSFTASTKALLSQQYAQMNLPPSEIFKLTGPATIEGDALTVSLFNGTDWHVSEIDVALTLVKTNIPQTAVSSDPTPPGQGLSPAPFAAPQSNLALDSVRPEKKADHTVIYKMRAPAPPLSATTFSAPLDLDLAPGQEWHWAILEAKGYPPQNRLASTDKTSTADAQTLGSTSATPPDQGSSPLPVALTQPQ
jgi:hypothetical protein